MGNICSTAALSSSNVKDIYDPAQHRQSIIPPTDSSNTGELNSPVSPTSPPSIPISQPSILYNPSAGRSPYSIFSLPSSSYPETPNLPLPSLFSPSDEELPVVILADDLEINLLTLMQGLKIFTNRIEVKKAKNADELFAFYMLYQFRVVLIITDEQMPIRNQAGNLIKETQGVNAIIHIRQAEREAGLPPVSIALSTTATVDIIQKEIIPILAEQGIEISGTKTPKITMDDEQKMQGIQWTEISGVTAMMKQGWVYLSPLGEKFQSVHFKECFVPLLEEKINNYYQQLSMRPQSAGCDVSTNHFESARNLL